MRQQSIYRAAILTCAIIGSFFSAAETATADSILAVHLQDNGSVTKARGGSDQYTQLIKTKVDGGSADVFLERGFTVLLNRTKGVFELQVFRNVNYGNIEVNSIFASKYESSIEYVYQYDSGAKQIRQDHFVFPANSLTGWADPEDYVLMRRFAWREKFPTAGCTRPVYTSEEYGREYLEASCLKDRDSAVRFARKFINYVLGSRGL